MVRCVDCGYLCVRDNSLNQIVEADSEYRKRGHIPDVFIAGQGQRMRYTADPVCFKMAADLRTEMEGESAGAGYAVACRERPCGEFIPWRQGYSPREHDEMKMLQEVERRTLAWRDEELRWQKQVEAAPRTAA